MNGARRYDVAVVGARCAGASLATWLARAGVDVLVIDRDPLGSDQILSTHTIHPPGVALLDELGVGATIREVTPKSPRFRLRKERAVADIVFENGLHELCPRRARLDGLLAEAAVSAGAELRDRTKAVELVREQERVTGLVVERNGGRERIAADVVVGADGRRSWVATAVGAEEYLGYDAPRAMYWGYWSAPAEWRTEQYPFDMYISRLGSDIRPVFQTDDDQLLIGSLPPVTEALSWRQDPLGSLKRNLASEPTIAPLVEGRNPEGNVRGTIKERYFFRRGAGPGWALVGDAGHHKEFVIGDGITEALLQAKSLAAAIVEGGDGALTRWWRARDVEALPGYYWGRDEGTLAPVSELEELVVGAIGRSEELVRMMNRLPLHQCSPYDAIPGRAILPLVLGAVARGRLGVVPAFFSQVRKIGAFQRELRMRTRLLENATPA